MFILLCGVIIKRFILSCEHVNRFELALETISLRGPCQESVLTLAQPRDTTPVGRNCANSTNLFHFFLCVFTFSPP